MSEKSVLLVAYGDLTLELFMPKEGKTIAINNPASTKRKIWLTYPEKCVMEHNPSQIIAHTFDNEEAMIEYLEKSNEGKDFVEKYKEMV